MKIPMNAQALREAYLSGRLKPIDVVDEVYRRIDERGEDHVWAFLADRSTVRQEARALGERKGQIGELPLYGLPFGVKDNVHVRGAPTTCGCPGYSSDPAQSAQAVQLAIDAGAIFIGKQTLDQFATGLNGTRTLGAHCKNTFDPAIIPGGSSSGSAVAVAAGLVSFSLGSDTGGSGRVPAAMNNIVGLRPSMGLVSNRGMVLNNRSFDCIPVFALNVDDAYTVLDAIAAGGGQSDAFPEQFRFAIPDQLEFFGDETSAASFRQAVEGLRAIGGQPSVFHFRPFHEAGQLIFDSALVAERAASYGEVLVDCPGDVVPAVASILERAGKYTAVEAFKAQYRVDALREEVGRMFDGLDVMVTPTVPRLFRVSEMLAEPIARNAQVGYYTYGVGPLDLCALALPVALRSDGLPFGISLVGRAGDDRRLRTLGKRIEEWVNGAQQ